MPTDIRTIAAACIVAQEIGCPSAIGKMGPGEIFTCCDRSRPDSTGKRECFCENAARRVLQEIPPFKRPDPNYVVAFAWLVAGFAWFASAIVWGYHFFNH